MPPYIPEGGIDDPPTSQLNQGVSREQQERLERERQAEEQERRLKRQKEAEEELMRAKEEEGKRKRARWRACLQLRDTGGGRLARLGGKRLRSRCSM